MFVIPQSCEALMRLQVTQYVDDPMGPSRLAVQEALCYSQWLPHEAPDTVMDLGCGLGRTSVMLDIFWGHSETTYTMVDAKDRIDENLVGGWRPDHPEWCCNLDRTLDFMTANHIPASRISLLPLSLPWGPFWKWHLIISTLAVGFHWPIEDWLPRLRPVCHDETRPIFGVRHAKYNGDSQFDGFEVVGFAESGWKEDFLCLRLTV
jgi:hypothetical protein